VRRMPGVPFLSTLRRRTRSWKVSAPALHDGEGDEVGKRRPWRHWNADRDSLSAARLISNSLADTVRTLVAVGTARLASILATMARGGPCEAASPPRRYRASRQPEPAVRTSQRLAQRSAGSRRRTHASFRRPSVGSARKRSYMSSTSHALGPNEPLRERDDDDSGGVVTTPSLGVERLYAVGSLPSNAG